MPLFSGQPPGNSGLNLEGVPGAFGLYNTAIEQQSKDYGDIMGAYKGFGSSAPMQNLGGLAETGGYTEQDKANIRERDLGPIRSIYAGANRDVDRQRALQGGYAPNYMAAKTKLARDLSQTIGDRTTATNAGIAQNVAQNRIQTAAPYANAAFGAIQGQQSLYGATPGLAKTFGDQAMDSARLQAQINGQNPNGGGGGSVNSGMSAVNYKPTTIGQWTGGSSY